MVVGSLAVASGSLAAASAAALTALQWRRRGSEEPAGLAAAAAAAETAPPTSGGGETAEQPATAEVLLQEVGRRSRGILQVVTNKTNDQFSIPNLTKYLKMKGVPVHEGATPEETVEANARLLLELLDRQGVTLPATALGLRHELVRGAASPEELRGRFPAMQEAYVQQPLDYGRNSRYGDKWRISCYLVVMENWKPRIEPHAPMVECMGSVMEQCRAAYARWHCQRHGVSEVEVSVMNAFVTRYRPIAEEDQLKRHIDGANVDGSVILALPTDDPFEGGSLLVWDGKPQKEYSYAMQPGDMLFLENAVWHQSRPITSGTRWALVLFLRVLRPPSAAALKRGGGPAEGGDKAAETAEEGGGA